MIRVVADEGGGVGDSGGDSGDVGGDRGCHADEGGGDDACDGDVVLREPGNPLLVSIVYYCRYFHRALPTFTITIMVILKQKS